MGPVVRASARWRVAARLGGAGVLGAGHPVHLLHHVRHHVPHHVRHLGILNNRHKTFRGKNALQHMTTYKKKEVKSEASNGI